MAKHTHNTTEDQQQAYRQERDACLVRWVAREIPGMGKRRADEFFRNLASNSSREYATRIREEARGLWLQQRSRRKTV